MKSVILSLCTTLIALSLLSGQSSPTATTNIETTFIEAELEKYLDNTDRQEKKLLECIELDRRNPELQYQLGRLYHKNGDNRKALDYATKAVNFDSSNKWYQLFVADLNELLMDFTSANASLEKVVAMEPKNAVIQMRMAQNFQSNGNKDKSIAQLQKMQKTFGVTDQTTFKLLELYNSDKEYDKGVDVLKLAVSNAPKNVEVLNALANQYLLKGKDKEAEKIYRQVIELEPANVVANSQIVRKNVDAAKDSEYLYAIKPLIENPDLPLDAKVIELIPYVEQLQTDDSPELASALQSITEQLTMQYPDEAKAHSIRGDVMYLTGELAPALKSYNKTIDLNDEVFPVWAQKMNVLYDLGNTKELIQFSEKSIDYYPNQFEGYFWYALGQYDLGDTDEAGDYLEEMALVGGSNPLAIKWHSMLATLIGKCDTDSVNAIVSASSLDKSEDPLELHLVSRMYDKSGDVDKSMSYSEKAKSSGYVGEN